MNAIEFLQTMLCLQHYSGLAVKFLSIRIKEPVSRLKQLEKSLDIVKGKERKNVKLEISKIKTDIRTEEKVSKWLVDSCLFFEDVFLSAGKVSQTDAGHMHDVLIDKTSDFCKIAGSINDTETFEAAILIPIEKIEPNCVIINRKIYRVKTAL